MRKSNKISFLFPLLPLLLLYCFLCTGLGFSLPAQAEETYFFRSLCTDTTVQRSSDPDCQLKISFNGGHSNDNFAISTRRIDLRNFEISLDFRNTVLPTKDYPVEPWAYLYFSATPSKKSADIRSLLIGFSGNSNVDELRVHFFDNALSDGSYSGVGLTPKDIFKDTRNNVATLKFSVSENNFVVDCCRNGTSVYSTQCPLSSFTDSSRCNFDYTSCYVGLGTNFDGTPEFLVSDPNYGAEQPSTDLVATDIDGLNRCGNAQVNPTENGDMLFSVPADTRRTVFLTDEKFIVNNFSLDCTLDTGFSVGGAPLFVGLKKNKTLWDKESTDVYGQEGLYIAIRRTSETALSFSVHLCTTDAVAGDYSSYKRGETVANVPFDPATGKISLSITRDDALTFFEVSVNGIALQETLLVNQVKTALGGNSINEIRGYWYLESGGAEEAVSGKIADFLVKKSEALPPTDPSQSGGNGSGGNGSGGDSSSTEKQPFDLSIGLAVATGGGIFLVGAGLELLILRKRK